MGPFLPYLIVGAAALIAGLVSGWEIKPDTPNSNTYLLIIGMLVLFIILLMMFK